MSRATLPDSGVAGTRSVLESRTQGRATNGDAGRNSVDYHSHIVATLPAVETLGELAFPQVRLCTDDGESDESRRAGCSFGHASLAATGCWPVSMRSFDFFVSVIADWA